MIKKLALILSMIFIILTFVEAGYILFKGGKVNAGYACVPMVCIDFSLFLSKVQVTYNSWIIKRNKLNL